MRQQQSHPASSEAAPPHKYVSVCDYAKTHASITTYVYIYI